jgi:hypothetical protein
MMRVLGFLVLIAASGACSSGNTVAPPTAQLVISLAAARVAATRGSHIAVAAEVTRENGAASAVLVTVSTPTGVTASVGNQTTTGNTTTVSISINVASTTLPGSYTVAIHAAASGFADAASQIVVDVN